MIKPKYIYSAKVTNIVDGDTIDVIIDVGFSLKMKARLRLNRINTYEMKSKIEDERILAVKAKEFLNSNLLDKDVVIQTFKTDAFGRYLTEVFYQKIDGGQYCINDELLNINLAKIYINK